MKFYTVNLRFFLNRRYIGYLKSIIEAYDNLAVLSSVDSVIGLVSLSVAVANEGLIKEIIGSLPKKISASFLDRKLSLFKS